MSENDPRRTPVIVAATRTAVGKAKRGSLASVRPEVMASTVIKELLRQAEGVNPAEIDDVILGCAFPEGQQGLNIARLVSLQAGLPDSVPAETINRFCASGLQSIAHAAFAIMSGQLQTAIAGGVESMSMVPMTGFRFAPSPKLAFEAPEYFTNMGLTAENVAEKYDVSRQDQDEFALRSNRLAAEAVNSGKFDAEIVPLEVEISRLDNGSKTITEKFKFSRDEGPRPDTSLEALAKLRPVFMEGGTVTAGNSSQMSDGSAGVMIMSLARAKELGLTPLARFVSFAAAGVPPDYMGIGPLKAVPLALRSAGLDLKNIELIELNEAFAAQSLAVIRQLEFDLDIVNVNGGAIALGHPLGCTGAKLTTQLIHELKRRNAQFGMVTMCIGGGMGAAGIFENLN
ncbi:MAG: thiolase family protein [Anaerolineales bacterium]